MDNNALQTRAKSWCKIVIHLTWAREFVQVRYLQYFYMVLRYIYWKTWTRWYYIRGNYLYLKDGECIREYIFKSSVMNTKQFLSFLSTLFGLKFTDQWKICFGWGKSATERNSSTCDWFLQKQTENLFTVFLGSSYTFSVVSVSEWPSYWRSSAAISWPTLDSTWSWSCNSLIWPGSVNCSVTISLYVVRKALECSGVYIVR